MQQIADWLEKLGMSEYAQRFAENGVDVSVLPHLTDQDLKDIGVLLGHRRKMLAAIADLDDTAAVAVSSPVSLSVPPVEAVTTTPVGERRHVTVMFCDLVDSTGIAARLDAEEWRDLVGAYLDTASAAVTEMGGKVAKKLGDGLMALFGYPVAQENDAERAVRAALSIQRSLTDLNRTNEGTDKPKLSARIAIDLGPVVVDATGEIFGDVPNVAARAQALAEPGSVVVTARVQRQMAGLFVVEERGSHELKGVPEPVMLYRIVRASGAGRRAGQRHLTPLVGREEELAMLTRRWERARQGDGQLVLVVGEPGLGKSRLIEEFHTRLREVPHTWVEWSSSQLLQNTPLHPLAEWGRMRFGGPDVSVEQRLADLENTLAQIQFDPAENVALLAPLLDIPLPPERRLELAPEELRRRQMAALTNWVMAGARAQPIVLAVEDAHWADPSTLDLLRGIAERGALAPLFVLITARPELRPPWGVRSHHGTISLVPLDRHQVQDMVSGLAARHALAKEVVEEMTERTGGVPLFVEELTRLLLERGEKGAVQAIPPTLQQSLTARLDRLGSARDMAQIGAVIGRDFSYPLIRSVAAVEDAPLQAALDQLADADILLVQGLPPNSDYRFKHALIQDAAYENLLKSRRQVLHRRIAETLRDNVAVAAVAEPELLAHHFTQAGITEAAIEWWGKAGHRSLERSALREAGEQFIRAVSLVESLPSTPALRRQQINFQVGLANALMDTKGRAAPETKASVDQARNLIKRAVELGETLEDPLVMFSVLYGLWNASYITFNGEALHELSTEILTLAEKQATTAPVMIGHRLMAMSLLHAGHVTAARTHFDHAITLYDPAAHRSLAIRFGQDARVAILAFRSLALWLLGYPKTALADADQAVKYARQLGQTSTLMYALGVTKLPQFVCGNYVTANALIDELDALANDKGAVFWKGTELWRGWIFALTGEASEAVRMIIAGDNVHRSIGTTLNLPFGASYLASAYAQLARFDDARRCIGEAITATETSGERWCEAEINRIAGEIELKLPGRDTTKAEAYFERALVGARQQQAKSWELRAATSMARLWRNQGKRDEARELLAPVYGWFTEGFDTLDLKEAKALLDALC